MRENVNMLVYIQPHAFVVLNRQNGVGVWNMMTGDHVKHINNDFRLKKIKTNGNEIIFSRCCCRTCQMELEAVESNYIFVFDAPELSNPNVPAENVRCRELMHSGEVGNTRNVEAAINNTGIVAVFPKPEEQRQGYATAIKTFEFWRGQCATEEDERICLGKMVRLP